MDSIKSIVKGPYWKYLPHAMRYVLGLAVVVVISLLYPNRLNFKYEFEPGQIWKYDDLEAPFDFAIRKSEEAIASEQQELIKQFPPCYKMEDDVQSLQIKHFEEEFKQQLEQVKATGEFEDVTRHPGKYISYGKQMLEGFFREGIIELAPAHENSTPDFVVQIIDGNTAQRQILGNLLTLKGAKSILGDSLPYSKLSEPDFLYPLLESALAPNLFYSDTLTEKFKNNLLEGITPNRGMVQKGDLIVPRNGVITDETYQKLLSYKYQYETQISQSQSYWGIFAGYFVLTSLVLGLLTGFLQYFAPMIFWHWRKLIFVFSWILAYSYLVYLVEQSRVLSPYLIPFAIVPIVIKTFFDEWIAILVHVAVVLIAGFITALGYEFVFLQVLAGFVVFLSKVSTQNWSKFFSALIFIFLSYALGHLGLSLIQNGSLLGADWSIFPWLFINVFLTLFAFPLIPLMERLFGFVSPITLLELSDMNKPLLRELAIKAPGTLQHSLQVANLAEEAARRIGADALLIKVAALYHDIGKIQTPEFFVENQVGHNPHHNLPYKESARMIINHVVAGVQMAKKQGLPSVLIDFILTHHGTTRTEYFYRHHVKALAGELPDDSEFRYPGPKPRTREESILMLADSIEAACKSLHHPTEEDLSEKIDSIIHGKVNQGQFENAALSFKDLETCRKVFKRVMRSVHHQRIAYPEDKNLEGPSSSQ